MKKKFEITSMALHVMAMLFMLSDHLWATVIPWQANWMTCVGRLAFPIFAFMTVEGFFYTKNLKRYMGRMLLFAIISEIPFNLMTSGSFIYPFHQNVLWTFLLGLLLMNLNEKAKKTGKLWLQVLTAMGTFLLGTIVGMITFVDYMHYGIWMILVFYFFRGRQWWNYVCQFVLLAYINYSIRGLSYDVTLFGTVVWFPQQCFALLALIPIWLYRGKQGPHNKFLQYTYYAFYPLHLLILGLLVRFL